MRTERPKVLVRLLLAGNCFNDVLNDVLDDVLPSPRHGAIVR